MARLEEAGDVVVMGTGVFFEFGEVGAHAFGDGGFGVDGEGLSFGWDEVVGGDARVVAASWSEYLIFSLKRLRVLRME
jgi:hypothetical protein